jgi:tetraacyldisaccharide-1-P 4'-kinase
MEQWGKANMSDLEFAVWFGMLYPGMTFKGAIGKTGEYFIDHEDYDDTSITEQASEEKFKKDAVKLVKSAPNGVENFNKGMALLKKAKAKQQAEKS